jgi:hypothetical protein
MIEIVDGPIATRNETGSGKVREWSARNYMGTKFVTYIGDRPTIQARLPLTRQMIYPRRSPHESTRQSV